MVIMCFKTHVLEDHAEVMMIRRMRTLLDMMCHTLYWHSTREIDDATKKELKMIPTITMMVEITT